jgi:hypothetical protein
VLPVPPFVTREWLAPRVAAHYGLLKELHKGREEIQQLSGYPNWPDRQPSLDEFIDILMDGFRYPCFVRAITRVAVRHVSSASKRKKFNFFKPFSTSSRRAVAKAARVLGRQSPSGDGDEMRQLADAGNLDVALGRMFLITLGAGANGEYLEVARASQAAFGSIIPFLEAAERHLGNGDFDWQRDVIDSHRCKPATIEMHGTEPNRGSLTPEQESEIRHASNKVNRSEPSSQGAPSIAPTPAELPAATHVPPEHTVPGPAAVNSDFRREAQNAARIAWDCALGEMVRVAQTAIGREPCSDILFQLLGALKAARSEQKTWESSKPVLVDTHRVAEEARQVTLIFAEFAEHSTPSLPVMPTIVTSEAAEEAITVLAQARSLADTAETLQKEAKALMTSGDLRKLDAVMAIKSRLRTLASDGLNIVGRAVAVLASSTACSTSTQMVVIPEAGRPPFPVMPEGPALTETMPEIEDDAALELLRESTEPGLELPESSMEGQSGPEPVADEPVDPFAEKAERKLITLFCRHEFGLAYHLLRAAHRVFQDHLFPFAEAELRLAAMSGHTNHAVMQGSEMLRRLLTEALDIAEELRTAADDLSHQDAVVARGIVLHAVLCPLALFHPASPAVQVIQALDGIVGAVGDGLRSVSDAVIEAAHSGLPFTPAALRSASQETDADTLRYGEDCRAAVLAKIRVISELRFPFQLGNKVRAVLASNEGAIGVLRLAMERDGAAALEAARTFVSRYSDRSGVIALVLSAESHLNSRIKGIDGAARERLIGNIIALSSLCAEFLEARDATPAVRNRSNKPKMQRIRDALCSGADRAIRALGSGVADRSGPLTPAAVRFAIAAFEEFKATAQGRRFSPAVIDHLLAVHAPLLWLPGLNFGHSWLPSPYQPERVVETILRAPETIAPPGNKSVAALEAAVRAREEEGSFVAARILIETGAFFGAPEDVRASLMEGLEVDIQARRAALERMIEDVRRRVDRMERMGHLAQP